MAIGLIASTPGAFAAPRPSDLVSVIVRGSANTRTAEHAIVASGGRIGQRLDIIHGYGARIPASALTRLTSIAGVSVTPDTTLSPLSTTSGYDGTTLSGSLYNVAWEIGARTYWSNGYTGRGVDVALIDSGVSPVAGLDTPGKIVNGADLSFESQVPDLRYLDTYGHGTHMAGIIAGRDSGITQSYSQDSTNFIGIAPDARIVSVKVANAMGATDVSQVIAAIDWVVKHRRDNGLNIRVLNLSFGTDGVQNRLLDPLAFAVEQAWHAGIVVVVAAGNAGFGSLKLNDPAYDPFVIAVGADNPQGTTRLSDDVIPAYSSTGDTKRNPDLVAPGESVVSLRVPASQLDLTHPEGRLYDRFFKGSGTSQAAAVVSGAAALIIQQRPDISPDELKQLLNSTAAPLPNANVVAQGHGLVHLSTAFSTPTDTGYTQSWLPATGEGSLEAARGTLHVADGGGVQLVGEMDIFGAAFASSVWAAQCALQMSWVDGSWNGNVWTGDSWSGNSWSATIWSGNSWSGNSWSGNSWSGNSWSGNSWSGNSWSGNSWSGNSWNSAAWSGVSWGKK
jgi:serine protease AprX